MACYKNCEQGRDCDCARGNDRAFVVVAVLVFFGLSAIGFGIYKLVNGAVG